MTQFGGNTECRHKSAKRSHCQRNQHNRRMKHNQTRNRQQCRKGGSVDPSINPNFCHGEISQCQDAYASCGGGLDDSDYYQKYKYYKRLYKNLINN